MSEELLDVYDEYGMETGEALPKSEIHKFGILHRTVQIWLYNGNGGLILQKRALTKKSDPGKWAIPGGHVDSQEESRVAATRELFEEMGIEKEPDDLLYLGTIRYVKQVSDDFMENEIVDVYITVTLEDPSEIKLNREVIENKYFSLSDIDRAYSDDDPLFSCHPDAFSLVKEYINGTY